MTRLTSRPMNDPNQQASAGAVGAIVGHSAIAALLAAPQECASCHSTKNIIIDVHWADVPFCTDCLERAEASETEEDAGVGD